MYAQRKTEGVEGEKLTEAREKATLEKQSFTVSLMLFRQGTFNCVQFRQQEAEALQG